MSAPDVPFIGGHPADIIREPADLILIEIGQCPSHLVGMVLVHAEYDGLGEPVILGHEIGQVPGDGYRAGLEGY